MVSGALHYLKHGHRGLMTPNSNPTTRLADPQATKSYSSKNMRSTHVACHDLQAEGDVTFLAADSY